MINCFVYLIQFYFSRILHLIEVYDAVIGALYLAIIIGDFKYSEYVYDNLIEECVHWQEGRIDRALKGMQEYIEANTKDWMISIKDLVINSVKQIIIPIVMDFIWNARKAAPQKNSENDKVDKIETPKSEATENN